MEQCKYRLTLKEVFDYVSPEEIAGIDLIMKNGGCLLAAKDFLANPPYCAYPDKSHNTCPIAQKYGDQIKSR